MLRIGCLGAAKIAPKALIAPAALRDDVVVSAIAARDAERAKQFAAENGIDDIYTDYLSLIASPDIDIIYNALPPSRHCDLSLAALEAGKHVLCEKPIAMNAVEAQRMAETARASESILMEAFHYRFHPAFKLLMEHVSAGEIGAPEHIRGRFSVEIPARAGEIRHTLAVGGGALMDLGCYPVHWVRMIAGREGRVVSASAQDNGAGIDLATRAQLDFGEGLGGEIYTDMSAGAGRDASLQIVGARGRIAMQNPLAPHLGYRIELWRDGAGEPEILAEAGAGELTTYDYQLAHFVDLVARRADPLLPVEDGAANMALIDEIYRAAGMAPRGL